MVGRVGEIIQQAARLGATDNISDKAGNSDFANLVKEAAQGAIGTLREGETMGMKGITGEADLTDVVSAVNSAETTLQLVTTLRDRMVQAYQEILRMPI